MHFPLIVILNVSIFVCQVLSEDSTYEYSDQHPWPYVYTVYPFYNSETLLEVWKTNKAVDISTNVVTLAPDDREQKIFYSDDQRNDTNLQTQNNVPYFISEVKNINEEQLSRNKQRLSNYRNRHREVNLQNE
ncbi:uncharacterized protein LOC143145774 [Ptiloglossa arizonensis]|uniref:uncharacterized protein LOC143145774 n=1 Tax=Ptiloglossa arizonensis TaxID=3350558 RepID=UPI003FA027A2